MIKQYILGEKKRRKN